MGTLLKAELLYSRQAWLIAYAIAAGFLVVAVSLRNWDAFGYTLNTTITYFIVMGILGIEADQEKRTRGNALLPLPPRRLALLEVAYVTLFQLGMVALWLVFLAFKPQFFTAHTLWGMVSMNGITLGGIMLFCIHTHLGFFGERRYQRITFSLPVAWGLAIGVLVYTGWIGSAARWAGGHFVSWSGALATTLVWLALSCLSVALYERRRSYLG